MSVRSDAAQFDWKDPFLMESQLSEEERLVRDTARQYAQEKLLPRVKDAYVTSRLTRRFSVKWARSACWAQPFRVTAAQA